MQLQQLSSNKIYMLFGSTKFIKEPT